MAPARSMHYGVFLLAGSGVVGVTQFLWQVLGARALGAQFAPVAILWTVQYLVFAIFLFPVETLRLRAPLRSSRPLRADYREIATYAAIVASGVAAISWIFRDQLLNGDLALIAAVVMSTLVYTGYVLIRAAFARAGRLQAYALLAAGESTLRFAIALFLVVSNYASVRSYAWSMLSGALVLVVLLSPSAYKLERGSPSSGRPPWLFLGASSAANAIAQLLLAGGPLVLPFIGGDDDQVATSFFTLALMRAPLVLGYTGLLAIAWPLVTKVIEEGDLHAARKRFLVTLLLCGSLVAVSAALLGPALIALLFGEGIRPPADFTTFCAVASVVALGNLLLNQALAVQGRDRALLMPWGAGLCIALLVIVAVPDPMTALGLSFLLSELGVALLLVRSVMRA